MPIPKPREDEGEDTFLDRCMGDETMVDEYSDNEQRFAVCNSLWERRGKKEEVTGKVAFRHNSTVEEGEPKWGDVKKTKLPRVAHADHGEVGKKSTWKYPHHWVKNGGDLDDDGIFTTGEMYLHEGGLNAAWAAAQGARTGEEASEAVKEHLQKHRTALGKTNDKETKEDQEDTGMKNKVKVKNPSDEIEEETFSLETFLGKDHVPNVDKDARRKSTIRGENCDLQAKARLGKAKAKDPGWVQGYAAVWDNVDLGGEIMRKGAFDKSISERVAAGKVKLMVKHFAYGGDVLDCIGTITEAKEDATGLWFNAKFSGVEVAQKVRSLILEGHVDTCSVGYMPVKWNWLNLEGEDGAKTMQVLEHLECKFYEVTITVVPMNEKAELTAAKSLDLVASKVKDIAEKLDASEEEAPSDDQKAAVLTEAFGGEAEAVAFSKSLVELSAMLDRVLNTSSESEDTAVPSGKAADLRQIKLDTEKRRLDLEKLAT